MSYETVDRHDAVKRIIAEEVGLPYTARASDYVFTDEPGEVRDAQLARLKDADREADERNAAFIDRVITAALSTDWPPDA